ncbi:hypothetical protein BDR06DRAFT_968528 [Suillus hirtellus]|nr:hypothetical protein BDR06DRAFT_968528 [Suillus hirtellus]
MGPHAYPVYPGGPTLLIWQCWAHSAARPQGVGPMNLWLLGPYDSADGASMPTGYNPYFHPPAVDYFWMSGSPLHPPVVVDPVIHWYLISAAIAGATGNSSAPVFQPSRKFMGPLRIVDSSLFLITSPIGPLNVSKNMGSRPTHNDMVHRTPGPTQLH